MLELIECHSAIAFFFLHDPNNFTEFQIFYFTDL